MTSILLRLLILIALLWLLRRFLGKILSPAKPQGTEAPGTVAKNMVKDPVCGMYMDARLAVRVEGRKEPVYFCSEECKSRFLGKSTERKDNSSAPPL